MPSAWFDWPVEAVEEFRGLGVVMWTFDQDGLFLNGDLVMKALPSELVTAFLDLIACCVSPTGVARLADPLGKGAYTGLG